MHKIHISELRIDGFRGLKDFKMSLSETTVLTGVNNVGKTTVLKAMQLLFGDSSFLTSEDLHIEKNLHSDQIIVDAKIIATDDKGERISNFPDDWAQVFETKNLRTENDEFDYIPLRVKCAFSPITNSFTKETQVLKKWEEKDTPWQDLEGQKFIIDEDCFTFHYISEKRDIQEDLRNKTSYLFRRIGNLENDYNTNDLSILENKMNSLNAEIIEKNTALKDILKTLKGIDLTMDSSGKVSVSPFARNLRDLKTTLTILFGTEENSFSMDYHGMGTRSWSSLLTFKAFLKKIHSDKEGAFLPIIAIEEPEAHLHPYAQKQLYKQMNEMHGLKVISTHSPYVAATADLSELRGMYKNSNETFCGSLPIEKLDKEDQRKIKQAVLRSNGELIFAKAIVLIEGETEAQALPILYEKYFGINPLESGILFVDAKGCGNYYPFILIASAFNIPWYIFSDGEKTTINNLNRLMQKVYSVHKDLNELRNIFVIPDEKDFEGMLLQNGYIDEIEKAVEQLLEEGSIDKFIQNNKHKSKGRKKTAIKCPTCNQYIYKDIERNYDGEDGRLNALDDLLERNKTQYAPLIAMFIAESNKPLPPLMVEMFDVIKEDIGHV